MPSPDAYARATQICINSKMLDAITAPTPSIEQINVFHAGVKLRSLGLGPLDEYTDQYGVVLRTSFAVGDNLAVLYNEYLQNICQALKIDTMKLDFRGSICFQSIDLGQMRAHYVYRPYIEAVRSGACKLQVLEGLNSRVRKRLFVGGFQCGSE